VPAHRSTAPSTRPCRLKHSTHSTAQHSTTRTRSANLFHEFTHWLIKLTSARGQAGKPPLEAAQPYRGARLALPIVAMDLHAIACQPADAWQRSASSAAARMRGPDGFFTVQLTAADAAIVQVRRPRLDSSSCPPQAAVMVSRLHRKALSPPPSNAHVHEAMCSASRRQPSGSLLRRWTLTCSGTQRLAKCL